MQFEVGDKLKVLNCVENNPIDELENKEAHKEAEEEGKEQVEKDSLEKHAQEKDPDEKDPEEKDQEEKDPEMQRQLDIQRHQHIFHEDCIVRWF